MTERERLVRLEQAKLILAYREQRAERLQGLIQKGATSIADYEMAILERDLQRLEVEFLSSPNS